MRKLALSALLIAFVGFSSLHADIKGINVDELKALKKSSIKVIDIRTKKDIKETGVIPGSYRLSFYNKEGKIDQKKWLHAFVGLIKSRQIKFVLISGNGKRAELGAEALMDKKGYKNPYYLKGGIDAWIDADEPVQKIK